MFNKLKSYKNRWNTQKIGSNKFVHSSDIGLKNKSKTSDETLLRTKKSLGTRAQELLEQAGPVRDCEQDALRSEDVAEKVFTDDDQVISIE